MSLVHERQHPLPLPPPPLNPPSMDVATLVGKESNGLSYPTPSSASTTVRPSLSLPPQNMSEPSPTSTMVNGRIYRYVNWNGIRRKASDESYSLDIVQQPVRARMCGFGDKVSRDDRSGKISDVGTEGLECMQTATADTRRCAGQTAYHTTALYQTCGEGRQHQQGTGHKVSGFSFNASGFD